MKKTSSLLILLVPFLLVSCAQKQVDKEVFLNAISKIEKNEYKEALVSYSGSNKEKRNLQYYYNDSSENWISEEDTLGMFNFLFVPLSEDYVQTLTNDISENSNSVVFYVNPFAIEIKNTNNYTKMTYNKCGYIETYFLQKSDVTQDEEPSLEVNVYYK